MSRPQRDVIGKPRLILMSWCRAAPRRIGLSTRHQSRASGAGDGSYHLELPVAQLLRLHELVKHGGVYVLLSEASIAKAQRGLGSEQSLDCSVDT